MENPNRESKSIHRYRVEIYTVNIYIYIYMCVCVCVCVSIHLLCIVFVVLGEFSETFVMGEVRKF